MFTARQIEAAIEEQYDGYENEFYNELDSETEIEPLGVTAYYVDGTQNGEGGGEYMDVVFRVGQQLFRKVGTYSSWDANEWDGALEEVEPYEVTVVRYREVKR